MINKTKQLFKKNSFLKDSSILLAINILAGLFNFALQPVASNLLGNNFDVWVSLTSITSIVLTFVTGITTEVVKKTSKYQIENPLKPFLYHQYIKSFLLKITLAGLVLSPILGFALDLLVGAGSWVTSTLLVVSMFLLLYTGINQSFLLGMLLIKKYGVVTISNNSLKFIFTVLLLLTLNGLVSLPLGLIFASGITFVVSELLIKTSKTNLPKERKKVSLQESTKETLKAFSGTGLILFFLNSFFFLGSILSNYLFLDKTESNLYAVLVFFGQIMFFGSVAFMTGLVAHASRDKTKKTYYTAIAIVSSLSVFIGVFITLLGPSVLDLMGKGGLSGASWLILVYSIFIATYNIIYVSIQYLIAINSKLTKSIIWATVFLLLGLFFVSVGFFDVLLPGRVEAVLIASVVISATYAVFLVRRITLLKPQNQTYKPKT